MSRVPFSAWTPSRPTIASSDNLPLACWTLKKGLFESSGFGLAPADYADFLQLVRQGGALGEAGTSRHLLAMGQDMC